MKAGETLSHFPAALRIYVGKVFFHIGLRPDREQDVLNYFEQAKLCWNDAALLPDINDVVHTAFRAREIVQTETIHFAPEVCADSVLTPNNLVSYGVFLRDGTLRYLESPLEELRITCDRLKTHLLDRTSLEEGEAEVVGYTSQLGSVCVCSNTELMRKGCSSTKGNVCISKKSWVSTWK